MQIEDNPHGPPIMGKHLFTPYSGFISGTPVFTHYTPARQGYYTPETKDDK